MGEVYRVWVKYPAVPVGVGAQGQLPRDFNDGAHGTIVIDIDNKMWFAVSANQVGRSSEMAIRQFGASGGELGSTFTSSGGVEMWVGKRLVGIFDLAKDRTIGLRGVIGVEVKNIAGGYVWSKGLYFSRPPTWNEQPIETRLGELMERSKKYAGAELAQLIATLIIALPVFALTFVLLSALSGGSLLAAAIGGVLAVCLAVSAVGCRGAEYYEQISIVDQTLRSTEPGEADLERGAKAFADFLRMVLEDVCLAAAVKAGQNAVARSNAKHDQQTKTAIKAMEEAFARHEKEEYERLAKIAADKAAGKRPPMQPEASYTPEQLAVIDEHAFKDAPKFTGRSYAEAKAWVVKNGFVFQKAAIFESSGRNSNAGGSEIFIRRSPELEQAGLCEVIRFDRGGHRVAGADGKEIPGAAGGFRHMHKDVIPLRDTYNYCRGFVPKVKNVNDAGNIIDMNPKTNPTCFEQQHIRLADK